MKKYTDKVNESNSEIKLEATYEFKFGTEKNLRDCFKDAYKSAKDSAHKAVTDEIYKILTENGFETLETFYDADHLTLTFEKSYIYYLTIWSSGDSYDSYRFYLHSYDKTADLTDYKRVYQELEPRSGYKDGIQRSLNMKETISALKFHENEGHFQ